MDLQDANSSVHVQAMVTQQIHFQGWCPVLEVFCLPFPGIILPHLPIRGKILRAEVVMVPFLLCHSHLGYIRHHKLDQGLTHHLETLLRVPAMRPHLSRCTNNHRQSLLHLQPNFLGILLPKLPFAHRDVLSACF